MIDVEKERRSGNTNYRLHLPRLDTKEHSFVLFSPARLFLFLVFNALFLCAIPMWTEQALLDVKSALVDTSNELYEWVSSSAMGASGGHCSWRGIICDNVTFSVTTL
jgi:hypothetical protein